MILYRCVAAVVLLVAVLVALGMLSEPRPPTGWQIFAVLFWACVAAAVRAWGQAKAERSMRSIKERA